jgi:hypothetical protein
LKKVKNLFNIFLFFLILYSSGLTQQQEENQSGTLHMESHNLLIIVDSSRSMLQLTTDGKEKLWAAKTALSKLIDKLPDDTNVGLMVFGHREKYRCDDIEMVLPIAPLNKPVIKKKLEVLKPTGVTPLTTSLDKAAQHLEKFKDKSTILLLTDGKETCGGDPVGLVSNISKQYSIIVIVDVVGLNVTSSERKQLEAIAKAGRGNYYSTSTSHELFSAVTDVVEQRVIETGTAKNSNEQGKQEKEETVEGGELGTLIIKHQQILSSISIYDKDTDERMDGRVMWIHLENEYSTHLEPGMYRIEIYSSSKETPVKIENVKIKAGKKTTINVE